MNTIMVILQLIFFILFIVQFFCHIVYKLIIYPMLALVVLLIGIVEICTNDTWWGIMNIVCAFVWMYFYYSTKNKIKNILSQK